MHVNFLLSISKTRPLNCNRECVHLSVVCRLSKDAVGIISCLVFLGIGLLVIVVMFYKSRRQAAHQIEEQTPVLGVDKGTQQLSYRRLNYGSLSPEIDENMV